MLEEQPGGQGRCSLVRRLSGEKGGLRGSQGLRAVLIFNFTTGSVTCCVCGSSGLFRLGLSSVTKSSRWVLILRQPDFGGCTKAH